MLVFIGTYTGPKSQGIYVSHFNLDSGVLEPPELAVATPNPTFLALHPKHQLLYAVNETDQFEGKPSGSVSAFRFDNSGQLKLLNQQASGGSGPCHLALDHAGKCVLVANYGSGSIAALPIEQDGSLGPAGVMLQHHGSSTNPDRQSGPHAHFITPDPANRFALTCDLGLDKVLVYKLVTSPLSLTPADSPWASVAPGAGPRHLAFHPGGRVAYCINEMGSTITVFDYDARHGRLTEKQTLPTLPSVYKGQSTSAEIQVHPSGRFVYASNRGHDSIAVFKADARTGKLTFLDCEPTQGKTPRHFALAPGGKWLIVENQDSNNIVVFAVDSRTGKLTRTGQVIEVGAPVCLVWASATSS